MQLSIVQEYLLLVLRTDGSVSLADSRMPTSLLAGGLLELKLCGVLRLDGADRLVTDGSLPKEMEYLSVLWTWIGEHEPVSVEEAARQFSGLLKSREMIRFIADIGAALERKGAVYPEDGRDPLGIPLRMTKSQAVESVVGRIRRELLEMTGMSGETAILVELLDQSGSLKWFFYAHEVDELENRLRDIKKYELPLQWSRSWSRLFRAWMSGDAPAGGVK